MCLLKFVINSKTHLREFFYTSTKTLPIPYAIQRSIQTLPISVQECRFLNTAQGNTWTKTKKMMVLTANAALTPIIFLFLSTKHWIERLFMNTGKQYNVPAKMA